MKKLYYYWFDDLIIKAGYFLEENAPLNNQEIIGDGFQKPILLNGVVVESITQAEIEADLMNNALQLEAELYKKRQCDGVNSYAEISAEFRLAKLSGVISEGTHSFIEKTLITVRNEVLSGQWMSARAELELIGTSIGQELYDRLHLQLTNYINENY
jgi:hypothetical protein